MADPTGCSRRRRPAGNPAQHEGAARPGRDAVAVSVGVVARSVRTFWTPPTTRRGTQRRPRPDNVEDGADQHASETLNSAGKSRRSEWPNSRRAPRGPVVVRRKTCRSLYASPSRRAASASPSGRSSRSPARRGATGVAAAAAPAVAATSATSASDRGRIQRRLSHGTPQLKGASPRAGRGLEEHDAIASQCVVGKRVVGRGCVCLSHVVHALFFAGFLFSR